MSEHRAGNLEQAVSEKENAGAEPEYFVREMKLAGHVQAREANVHAIDEGGDVEDKEEGNQSPRDFPLSAGRNGVECGGCGQVVESIHEMSASP